ncbi:MAG: hypothetical protein DMD78_02500 [Candidatus Rokuibacteriota bacterium]|nr:MAG: hypothetical protein DMD78_02500 [Candidatus Rokubacteria bacterium]
MVLQNLARACTERAVVEEDDARIERPAGGQRDLGGAHAASVRLDAWAFTATLTIPGLCASPTTVVAFALETSNTLTSGGSGGGGGAGKATIRPLVLTKGVDDCTPLLFKAAFTGEHFQTATLQVGTNKTPVLFTITLTALSFTSGGTTVQCSQATNSCQ